MDKVEVVVGIAVIAFAIISHALTFIAQIFKEIKKDQPGWLNTVTNVVAKVMEFLNGVKKA